MFHEIIYGLLFLSTLICESSLCIQAPGICPLYHRLIRTAPATSAHAASILFSDTTSIYHLEILPKPPTVICSESSFFVLSILSGLIKLVGNSTSETHHDDTNNNNGRSPRPSIRRPIAVAAAAQLDAPEH